MFSYIHGNGILQLSGSQAWATGTLAAALKLLSAPTDAALAQGKRLFEQEQSQLASDILIRRLLSILPDVVGKTPGGVHDYTVVADNAAVLVFYPLAENTAECLAATQILASLLEPEFFQQLRVEKNIGYVVSCRFHQTARQPGILFALQSPTYDAQTLLEVIDTFITGIPAMIEGIAPDTLAEKRDVLRSSLAAKPAEKLEAARQQWLREFACAPPADEMVIAEVTAQWLSACAPASGRDAWRIKTTI